jgi:hypothetical protein
MAEDDLTAISTTGLRWSTVLIIWLISASESSASIWASNASIRFQTSGSHTFDHRCTCFGFTPITHRLNPGLLRDARGAALDRDRGGDNRISIRLHALVSH